MFDGNRGKFSKIGWGLVAIITGSALLAVLVAWPIYLEQREAYTEATRNAADYSENANDKIALECSGLAGQQRDVCADEINDSAREHQRNEYDLAAQRTMALWTGVMGGMAVLGIALSAIVAYLVLATWRDTKRAADTSERSLEIQTRPFLYLDKVEHERFDFDEQGVGYGFTFFIKNLGVLPATNLRIWTYSAVLDRWEPVNAEFTEKAIEISACPQGVTRKVFERLILTRAQVDEFESFKTQFLLGIKIVFDTRFRKNKTVREYRWADIGSLRNGGLFYLSRREPLDTTGDLFADDSPANDDSRHRADG
ncbi:hypothetical protein [Aurantiacibacter hainanensis]|uniref:hypothetical protein n=1 Tax=Aurantiacibacter hainanensis TaxID=3076114 RepID=UPI0030C6A2DA